MREKLELSISDSASVFLRILRCIADTWMRENLELSISDSASVLVADLTVPCRNVDARKLSAINILNLTPCFPVSLMCI